MSSVDVRRKAPYLNKNALLSELQQGHRMKSLETLVRKLEEDRKRHDTHLQSIYDGLRAVRVAQSAPGGLFDLGSTKPSADDVSALKLASDLDPESDLALSSLNFSAKLREQVSAARTLQEKFHSATITAGDQVIKVCMAPQPPPASLQRSYPPSPNKARELVADEHLTHGLLAKALDESFTTTGTAEPNESSDPTGQVSGQQVATFLWRVHGQSTITDDEASHVIAACCDEVDMVSFPDLSEDMTHLKHLDDVNSVAFSLDGSHFLSAGEEGRVALWNVDTKLNIAESDPGPAIVAATFSHSGNFIAVVRITGELQLLHAVDLSEVEITSVSSGDTDSEVLSLATGFLSGNEYLAVGTKSKEVVLLTIPELEEICRLEHGGHVHCLCISPDGRFLAAGGGIDEMHGLMTKKTETSQLKTVIWEVASSGSCRNLGSIHSDGVFYAVAFSRNGKLLALAGEDCNIAVLLVERNFEPVLELPCTAGIRCLSWSPNGRCLVAAGEDRLLSVWDVVEARITHQFQKVEDWYCDVKWSTDGRWIASSWFGGKGLGLQKSVVVSRPVFKDSSSSTIKNGPFTTDTEQQEGMVVLTNAGATATSNDQTSLKVVIAIPLTLPSIES